MIEPVSAVPRQTEAVTFRPDRRLLEAMQTQQTNSVLFASLPRPNESSYQAIPHPELAPQGKLPAPQNPDAGRDASVSRSSVTSFGQAGTLSRASASGDSMAAIRTAQEIMRILDLGPPSAANSRIASEAYLMEMQAQQDYQNHSSAARSGMREWFA